MDETPASVGPLATVEILEEILLDLDMKTLLLATYRVCHFWHSVIDESSKLQEMLFFKPRSYSLSDDPRLQTWADRVSVFPRLNPLLVEKFSPVFFGGTNDEGDNMHRQAECFDTLPWTDCQLREVAVSDDPREYCVQKRPEAGTAHVDMDKARRSVCTRRGASWRRMLVSQPPPPFIGVSFPTSANGDGSREENSSEHYRYFRKLVRCLSPHDTPGRATRMGQLYDLVQYHSGHHSLNLLWTRIHWLVHDPGNSHDRPAFLLSTDHFKETPLVVEFAEFDNETWRGDSYIPTDIHEFDRDYRCDEFDLPSIEVNGSLKTIHHHSFYFVLDCLSIGYRKGRFPETKILSIDREKRLTALDRDLINACGFNHQAGSPSGPLQTRKQQE